MVEALPHLPRKLCHRRRRLSLGSDLGDTSAGRRCPAASVDREVRPPHRHHRPAGELLRDPGCGGPYRQRCRRPDAGEKIILEFTLSRQPALQGLVPKDPDIPHSQAERTARAFRAFGADGGEFTRAAVARILDDHRMFREDVAAGAFRPLRPVTR